MEALAALDHRFSIVEDTIRVGGRDLVLEKPRKADDLISEADFAHDERLPYWADLWPSAASLAQHLLVVDPAPKGARALELGCGLGLVTIAAQLAGYDVTATDYYEDALLFTARNALRATGTVPAVRMVDWRAMPDDLGRFDLVLAADVLYELKYGSLVARVIRQTLAPGGRAYVADQGRLAMGAFLEEADRLGLRVREVHRAVRTSPAVEGAGSTGHTITIHELRNADARS